jgi:thiamine monophosphate synthase
MPFYKLSKDALLETFDDGGLVLVLPERRLVELNPSAVEIVKLLDGQRSPEQVAAEIAKNYDISNDYPMKHIIQDVLELCMELNRTGVLELQPNLQESVE